MARAYSRYEYETSPRKLEPYYAPKKKNTNNQKKTAKNKSKKQIKKQKEELKMKVKIVTSLIAVFAVIFGISYRNAKIDEHFNKVQTLKSELAAIEKENAQLEVAIESNLNLTNLEQQARGLLGMQKLTNKQTEYVTLPKTDYIEAASEQVVIEEQKGLFDTIGDWINKLFK